LLRAKLKWKKAYFSKFETRLSAIEKANEELKTLNVELSAENEELKKQLAESPAEHTKFNPEAEAQRDIKFKIGARREETVTDRVFNSLF
jgi:regulator of replication initiation timing